MIIEFDCGASVSTYIDYITMAMRNHKCESELCQSECADYLTNNNR